MARYFKYQRIIVLLSLISLSSIAVGQKLSSFEQIPKASFEGMREVERYQLRIAEKYYLKKEYKVAMAEYEKFLTLYESSSAAPYAQLMWSQCLVRQRKVNTAIREGFRSVIDYWPDSEEAATAAWLIAKSYQDMGEVEKAKAAYRNIITEKADGNLAVQSNAQLLQIAKTEKDTETVLSLLEQLTYKTKRTATSRSACENASRELARYYSNKGNFEEATKALATSHKDADLDRVLYEYGKEGIRNLLKNSDTANTARSLGKQLIDRYDAAIPVDLTTKPNQGKARESLNRIASLYGTLNQPEQVLATYKRTEKMLGVSDGLLGQIAGYYRSRGKHDQAIETYLKYANQIKGKSAIAGMRREQGKFDQAIEIYQELTQQDAENINNYLWVIAECYEGKKDWKKAIAAYRQVDRFPANYLRIASCHRRLKQWDDALGLYNQIKAVDKHAAEATFLIGHTYEQAGRRENAIKSFQATCRYYPKTHFASKAHAHLQTKYNITATFGGSKE